MPIPESGLYINSLPGMPLMSIDMIANPEQVNFVGVWNDVQIRASHRLLSEVTSRFSKRYKIKSITHSNNIGKVIDAKRHLHLSLMDAGEFIFHKPLTVVVRQVIYNL